MSNMTESYIRQVALIPHNGTAGYFGPESITWRLYREPIVLFGGVRALLLQVAHPAVAEGVARYSKFKEDAFGRGRRTFEAMATIYFGTDEQARQTAMHLHRMHAGIKGTYENGPEAVAFNANQSPLLQWVLATLTHTTLLVFEHFPLKDLPPDWKERFYEESKTAALLLGIAPEDWPDTLAEFNNYFEKMAANTALMGSNPKSREITTALAEYKPYLSKWIYIMAAGWLPDSICHKIGVENVIGRRYSFKQVLRYAQRIYPWVPSIFRTSPAWYQAQYRVRKYQKQKVSPMERLFGWLGERYYLPLGIRLGQG